MTISTDPPRGRFDAFRYRYVNLALVLSLTLNGLMLAGILVAPHHPPNCPPRPGAEFAEGPDSADIGPRGLAEHGLVLNDDLD